MATFYDNLRTVSKLPTRGDMQKARRTRRVAYGSMDTSNNQQDNQVDSLSDKDYVVQNTFRMDRDGTNYGVGRDGKTYSYTIDFNNKVSEPKLLSAEEQRNIISNITDGKVEIDPDVTNQESLTDIIRSINRMYEKGNNLTPGKVNITKLLREDYANSPLTDVYGLAYDNEPGVPDTIKIYSLDNPQLRRRDEAKAAETKWSPNNPYLGEFIPTHELSHTAQFNANGILKEWFAKKEDDAKKYANKYTPSQLFQKAIRNTFGLSDDLSYEDSLGHKMLNDTKEQYEKWHKEFSDELYGNFDDKDGIFGIAAKNLGFDSVNEAAKTVSDYAGYEIVEPYYVDGERKEYKYIDESELFAEAYADVLLNDDEAAPYSKEIIKLYKNLLDKWEKKTGIAKDRRTKEFKQMFDALPNFKTGSKKNGSNPFVQNYRSAPWKYKK